MSYGFVLNNANGERVADSTAPTYYLGEEKTVSGTFAYNEGNQPQGNPDGTSRNVYNYGDLSGKLSFLNLNVGETAMYLQFSSRGPFELYSTQSSLTYRECVPANELVYTPSGYGMDVYDGSGSLTFSASEQMIPVYGKSLDLEFTPSDGVFNRTIDWVALTEGFFEFELFNIPDSFSYLWSYGVKRVSLSSYEADRVYGGVYQFEGNERYPEDSSAVACIFAG